MQQTRTGLLKRMVCLMTVFFVATTAAMAQVQGAVVKKDNSRLTGSIVWKQVSRKYVVTTPQGVTLEAAASDVRDLLIAPPPALNAAAQQVQRGLYAPAIPVLEKVQSDYTMLKWDVAAARLLMECYIGTQNHRKAVDMGRKVIEANPDAISDPGFASKFWDALLATGSDAELRKALTDAIQSGDRNLAAVAQIKRGDIDKKNGKAQDALLDGYLRTVVLFADIKEARPEALLKANMAFKEIGRHADAEKMRKMLMSEFPNSPEAQKLTAGS